MNEQNQEFTPARLVEVVRRSRDLPASQIHTEHRLGRRRAPRRIPAE
jgi:hypothetical protein